MKYLYQPDETDEGAVLKYAIPGVAAGEAVTFLSLLGRAITTIACGFSSLPLL